MNWLFFHPFTNALHGLALGAKTNLHHSNLGFYWVSAAGDSALIIHRFKNNEFKSQHMRYYQQASTSQSAAPQQHQSHH
jgi:hypothetical protein